MDPRLLPLDATPIVTGLLDALKGLLTREKRLTGLVAAIYEETRAALLPDGASARLSFGKSYERWQQEFSAAGRPCDATGIRGAFQKIARALPVPREGGARCLRLALKVRGTAVEGTLVVVQPKKQHAPAGFEVVVTLRGETYTEPLPRNPERRRSRPRTEAHIRADERVKLLQGSVTSPSPSTFLLERAFEGPAAPSEIELVLPSGLRVLAKRLSEHKTLVGLLLAAVVVAGTLKAFPELVDEAVQVLERITSDKPAAPVHAPRPTPPPTPHVAITADYRPQPETAPSGEPEFTADRDAGDLVSGENASWSIGTQPWLQAQRSPTCSYCAVVVAYPALRDVRPLRYEVDFGDGTAPQQFHTAQASATTARGSMGHFGVFYLPDPAWRDVYVLRATHTYPEGDASYVVTVAVRPAAAPADAKPIVTLRRRIRVESLGVVSTDSRITLPTTP